MEKDQLYESVKELTLMLIYLTSWKEKEFNEEYRRSWKGYDFGVLNELIDEELLFGSRKSKSVYIDENGIKAAKKLLIKYGINGDAKK